MVTMHETAANTPPIDKASNITTVHHDSYFGGKVEIIEALPVGVAGTTPAIYYAHGAGWAQEQPTIEEIARQGRRAFSMSFNGNRVPSNDFVVGHDGRGQPDSLKRVNSRVAARIGELGLVVPDQQMRAAASLLAVIEEQTNSPSGRVDAILQSESAGHGLIAANAAPDKFNNIVLAYPGGLSGKQKGFIPGRVARDFFARRRHHPDSANDFRDPNRLRGYSAVRMQLQKPGFREDAYALRHAHLPDLLHALKQKENAPQVTLVIGLHDGIFRMKDYFKHLVSPNDVDRIVIIPGGHAIGGRKDVLATILSQLQITIPRSTFTKPLRERISFPFQLPRQAIKKIYKLADMVDMKSRREQ